ncbi:YybH family protein [Sphingobium sp.]|uniref:YybH family protein n=1 Tax=Sphingobium sp. TaxID=1912891 RepID=UPI0028BDCC8F|nr:DUF4440 domain-containing protein [Sphingobium sp.]
MAMVRKMFVVGAALMAGGLLGAASPKPAPQSDPAAEITAAERKMEAIYNSPEYQKDPTIIHPYLSPDMILFDVLEPGVFAGEAAIRRADDIASEYPGGKVAFGDMKVHARGDMGYAAYIQQFTGKDAAGRPFSMKILTTDTWEKTDGRWWIVHQQATVPMDAATLVQLVKPKTN